ncbi:hypothetical protein ACA910_017590 [Epithemia clementina (nom. ined.)]
MPPSHAVEALCSERRQRRRVSNFYARDSRDVEAGGNKGILTNMNLLTQKNYGSLSSKVTPPSQEKFQENGLNKNNNTSNISNHSTDVMETASTTSSSCSWSSSLDDIPVPLKLRPFVKRLGDFEELTYEEICGILFVIRLADSMLKVAYASFLARSFVDELRKKLRLEDLDLEIEIAATRWTYQQGSIMTYHRFEADYDGYAMRELSRIALGVLEDSISVTEGLQRIEICEERTNPSTVTMQGVKPFRGFERFYR